MRQCKKVHIRELGLFKISYSYVEALFDINWHIPLIWPTPRQFKRAIQLEQTGKRRHKFSVVCKEVPRSAKLPLNYSRGWKLSSSRYSYNGEPRGHSRLPLNLQHHAESTMQEWDLFLPWSWCSCQEFRIALPIPVTWRALDVAIGRGKTQPRSHFFIWDKLSGEQFLINSGNEVNIINQWRIPDTGSWSSRLGY